MLLERAGTLARASLILVPLALLFGVLGIDSSSWSETRRLRGVVTGLHKTTATKHSSPTKWVVTLSDGPTVALPGTEGVSGYAQGREVLVIESRSRLLGRVRYRYGGPWQGGS